MIRNRESPPDDPAAEATEAFTDALILVYPDCPDVVADWFWAQLAASYARGYDDARADEEMARAWEADHAH